MLRIIQANDLALTLNVLAVCAVFVFVGVVLLGAFWVQEADDNAKSISRVTAEQYDTGRASMINQADQMRGNLIIDRVVSFILSSLIVALPFLTLLLIKYPLRSPWSL
jgi:hypothetical protein